MSIRNLKSPLYYLARSLLAAAIAALVWAWAFLPLGSGLPLSSKAYVGAGVFFILWLYGALCMVQFLRSLLQHWRNSQPR